MPLSNTIMHLKAQCQQRQKRTALPVLPPYLLKEPAEIALLHLYPLRIWGPMLASKKIYTPRVFKLPLLQNTLDAPLGNFYIDLKRVVKILISIEALSVFLLQL